MNVCIGYYGSRGATPKLDMGEGGTAGRFPRGEDTDTEL